MRNDPDLFDGGGWSSLLEHRARHDGERLAYTYIHFEDPNRHDQLSFAELDRRARALAVALRQIAAPGARALLLLPSGLDYVIGFWGCVHAGLIAVPAMAPEPERPSRTTARLAGIMADCEASVAITTRESSDFVRAALLGTQLLATDDPSHAGLEQRFAPAPADPDTVMILQYTSGSTSDPRGVVLSHENLRHNAVIQRDGWGLDPHTIGVSWLPLYHDLGVLSCLLQPVFSGFHTVMMATAAFVQRPLAWLEAISRWQGSFAGGPNFAFDLCVRKTSPEQRAALELGAWRCAFNGAEPVRADTLERFSDSFAIAGFRRSAFYPCYGMSEANFITGPTLGAGPLIVHFDRTQLAAGRAIACPADHPDAAPLVGNGQVGGGQRLRIVHPETATSCDDGEVGEIWLAGPSVGAGYWQRDAATRRRFLARLSDGDGPFLRTGDLGFVHDRQTFIVGRLDDLIIIRGRNHHPQDLERTVERAHPGLRPGCGAAFAVEVDGEPRVVITQELDRSVDLQGGGDSLFGAIRQALAEQHQLSPLAIVLVSPGTVPKTTSGKLQRRACREALLADRLAVVARWDEGEPIASQRGSGLAPQSQTLRRLLIELGVRVGVPPESLDPGRPATHYGLDSLRALELLQRLRELFGGAAATLSLRSIFDAPSLASLAETLDAGGEIDGKSPPDLLAAARDRELQLSLSQERLWFLEQLYPGSSAYTVAAIIHLHGPLDARGLQTALDEVAARHESLRTIFARSPSGPIVRVLPAAGLPLTHVDLTGIPEPERAAARSQAITAELERPFELERGPLTRTLLLRESETDHRLLVSQHHIISDLWSMSVLLRDLGDCYAAWAADRPSPLRRLPVQFVDFARWQREWLAQGGLDRQLEHWRDRLRDRPPALQLSVDHPRPAVQTFAGAWQPIRLSPTVGAAIDRLARSTATTPFMILLAAYAILLARHGDQQDLVIGVPVANRTHPATAELIGFFTNTLPLRVRLDGDPSFTTLLERVREIALDAFANQDAPFERLVEMLAPERDLGRSPLVQVMFALQNVAIPSLDVGGLRSRFEELDTGRAKFELTMRMTACGGGYQGVLEYNTALFEPATAARMAANFQVLLDAALARPDTPVARLPMLADEERQIVLYGWNQTTRKYAIEHSLHRLCAQQAARTPDAPAVRFEGQTLSHRELHDRAAALAMRLQAAGAGPGSLIGVFLDRSLELLVGVLAVLQVGAAYVPLDPEYPAERLAFMLADARATLVLTRSQLLAAAPTNCGEWIVVDDPSSPHSSASAIADVEVAPEDLAYVIYTSGSTGQPKGAMNSQRGVCNRLAWMQEAYPIGPGDRVLHKTPISFDVSVWELFWPLLTGACLVLARPGGHRDASYLADLIAAEQITVLHFVPSMLQAFLQEPDLERRCVSLRHVMCSGEALAYDLQERFFARIGAALHNLYGPTEAAIDVTFWDCRPGDPRGLVPIGRPIANTQIYILDQAMQPVPIGVPGELYIGGVGVGAGYLERPELTAERFLPDPFANDPAARIYRTGDRARFLYDGAIEFLGRLDHQVKLRGFRIELGEIEAVLRSHPEVRDAAVVVRDDRVGGPRLVAHIAGRRPSLGLARTLREHLRARLPEFMIPSEWVSVAALLLSPNGKLDRAALTALDNLDELDGEPWVGPRNPREELLASLWSELLGRARVSIHDDFFDLGGHSLLATQLMTRVRDAFAVELPLRTLFEHPTIARMATAIADAAGAPPSEAATLVHDGEGHYQPFPLTDVQAAYWVGRRSELELGNIASYIYVETDVPGLDVARLEFAIRRLIDRHDALRVIVRPDGFQQILEHVPPYRIAVTDLIHRDRESSEAQLQAIRASMSHQVFDPERWPLFDVRVARLAGDVARVYIGYDLLIGDARSLFTLLNELRTLYDAPDTVLPPLEISYRDYVLAELAARNSDAYRRSLDWWLARVPELPPPPELPLARDPATIRSPRFDRQTITLRASVWDRLKRRAARAGITPSVLLLAAYAEVLSTWSKRPRFSLVLTLYNRLHLHPQVDALVGDFTSLTVLAVDHGVAGTFEQRARKLQAQLWDDLDHRQVSGVRVLRELSRHQQSGTSALTPVNFTSVLNGVWDSTVIGDRGRVVHSISQTPQLWLDHQVAEIDGKLLINWDAIAELFPAGMLTDMFSAFCGLLRALASDAKPDAWTSPARLVPAKQLRTRAVVNDTYTPRADELLHSRIVEQARRRPDHVAVIDGERTIDYAELAGRAAAVASWLRAREVRPNTLVAIVMHKGWEQAVAALGVLRSGAAYVPIDPALPRERIQHLLAHGEVRQALTQSWVDADLDWPSGIERLLVDRDTDDWPTAIEPDPRATPDDLAYVIYTSGSTGLPKGVMIDHRGAVNTILDVNARFGVGPGDRVLALSSLSFDLSVYDLFGVLAAGGAVVTPNSSGTRDPVHWVELLTEHRVTLWNTVPALMEILVDYLDHHPSRAPTSLRLALLSGDWIPTSLPDRIRARMPGVRVISLGGATEASIWSIVYPIDRVDRSWASIPYGAPMANQAFDVLGSDGAPRPVWTPGMLHISGIGVARGYWRDPERTAAAFDVDPRSGARRYRTGDLGRYLPDGTIEFLGREDLQVKIQGFRIELGEIEAALAQHPAVRNVVVVAAGERHNRRLVGHVVLLDRTIRGDDLREFLTGKLPEHMVPPVIVVHDALPLTGNGKVDRSALIRRSTTALPTSTTSSTATTTAARIAQIAAEVLEIDEVEPTANLLDLGASSVTILRLVNRLEQALGYRPPFHEIYQQPTVAALAAGYQRQRGVQGESSAPAEVLRDAEAIAAFVAARPGLRPIAEGSPTVSLPRAQPSAARTVLFARRTHRQFSSEPVPLDRLGGLLDFLGEHEPSAGRSRRMYPSAGGIYAVQTYVHVKPDRVVGLDAGIHYHDPRTHRLVSLSPGAALARDIHVFVINQPVFDEAAFSLFLIAQTAATAPMYGELGRQFAVLEAGYMGQLLMVAAESLGLGLCPIGRLDFDRVRDSFGLDPSHVLVHSLLGGLARVDEDREEGEL